MENKGKRKFIKKEEEEEEDSEINNFVLGIMEGYSDSIIPPLSLFKPCLSLSESTREVSSSKKADIKKERNRRLKMNESYTVLESLVPGLPPKSTKEKVIHGTIQYIKYLEEKKKMMEKKKKSLMVLPTCTTTNTKEDSSLSLTISVCGRVGFFGIVVSEKRQGLLSRIFTVFQSHMAEILVANVAGDEDGSQLALTVTVLLNDNDSGSSSTTTTIEEIKKDILML